MMDENQKADARVVLEEIVPLLVPAFAKLMQASTMHLCGDVRDSERLAGECVDELMKAVAKLDESGTLDKLAE